MFKKKIKNFLIITSLAVVIFLLSSRTILAQAEETLFSWSLNFQKIIQDFFKRFRPTSQDIYKEKYYELLQELAKLKLTLKSLKETDIVKIQQKYQADFQEVKVIKKDALGNYYLENFPGIAEEMIVLDKNWLLVGRIVKVFKNYSLVQSLETPNLEFNVTDIEGNLLGLAKTISNGFLEVNFVDPQMKINVNDFVLTEKGIFPSGLVVGSVVKIYRNQFNQKIIVKAVFDPESSTFLVIKK